MLLLIILGYISTHNEQTDLSYLLCTGMLVCSQVEC